MAGELIDNILRSILCGGNLRGTDKECEISGGGCSACSVVESVVLVSASGGDEYVVDRPPGIRSFRIQ